MRLLFSYDFGTHETRVFFVPSFTTRNLYIERKEKTTKIDTIIRVFIIGNGLGLAEGILIFSKTEIK